MISTSPQVVIRVTHTPTGLVAEASSHDRNTSRRKLVEQAIRRLRSMLRSQIPQPFSALPDKEYTVVSEGFWADTPEVQASVEAEMLDRLWDIEEQEARARAYLERMGAARQRPCGRSSEEAYEQVREMRRLRGLEDE